MQQVKMRTMMFMTLLALFQHDTTAVRHTVGFFYTALSEVPDFPEFVSVGIVDGVLVDYFDSNIKKVIPKQDWMDKITKLVPEHWEHETQHACKHQKWLNDSIEGLKQRFNQTGGVHIHQLIQGCEWDDETGETNGYHQYGYDGEDLIVLDLKTMTFVAPNPQAVFVKNQLNNDKAMLQHYQNYYIHECFYFLEKYVNYGKDFLTRKDLPTVSLLQKSPSSRITCHATGFYPDRAVMFWRKDGEELHEGVDQGEILPNPDGSFQMSVDLLEPPTGDWEKYDCVFKLDGEEEGNVTKLEKREIKTNHVDNTITSIIVGVVALALIIAGVGFLVYRLRTVKRPPSPVSNSGAEQSMLDRTTT